MRPIVDPRFPDALRQRRKDLGIGLRRLGALARYSHVYVWELETGRKAPTVETAKLLDTALKADGRLAELVQEPDIAVNADERERLAAVSAKPSRVDAATIGSLATILDHQRRLEDAIGAAPMLAPVMAQLTVVEGLVVSAGGPLRPAVVNQAAQWAEFAGWLHTATEHPAQAGAWFDRALVWATEAGDREMQATALSFKGHLAFLHEQPGPTIGLSQAARRDQHVFVGQRAYDVLQEAKGQAMGGNADEVASLLSEADDLIAASAEYQGETPPWHYYRSPGFFQLEQGVVWQLLGRADRAANAKAIEALRSGLGSLPAEVCRSEWAGEYVLALGVAHSQAGDSASAAEIAAEARSIAELTGSARLLPLVDALDGRLLAR